MKLLEGSNSGRYLTCGTVSSVIKCAVYNSSLPTAHMTKIKKIGGKELLQGGWRDSKSKLSRQL